MTTKQIIFFLLTLLTFKLSAQALDKLQFKGGIMYELVTFQQSYDSTYTNFVDPSIVPYVNLFVGGYYALAHKNDIVSVGVDGGLQAGVYFQQGFAYQLQLPAYLMGRLGAGATSYNQQKFGIGAGVGLQSTFLSDSRLLQTHETIKTFLFIPSAIAEVVIGGNRNLIGRLHIPLLPMKKQLEDVGNGYFKLSNVGFGLIYRFGSVKLL